MSRLILSITMLVSLSLQSVYGQPYKTWYVDAANTGIQNGETWETAWLTIDDALNNTNLKSGDEILVKYDASTNLETIYDVKSAIDFKGKSLKLVSDCGAHKTYETAVPDADRCVINAVHLPQKHRVFTFKGQGTSASVVEGFTIRNGKAEIGSGILCDDSSPTIRGNIVEKNEPGDGWAHPMGFGIACINNANPTIEGNIIQNNSAKEWSSANPNNGTGAGIYCLNSSPIIRHNTIMNNDIDVEDNNGNKVGNGGGIACFTNSYPLIEGNIIKDNKPNALGGGIYCQNCPPPSNKIVIVNNLICSNNAQGGGGGVYCHNSSLSIINNTITDNASMKAGWTCGIMLYQGSFADIINTIVWENKGKSGQTQIYVDGNCQGKIDYCTYNKVDGINLLPSGFKPGANNNEEPATVALFVSGSDFHLADMSPCIDKGTNNPAGGLPLTDIQEIPRSLDGGSGFAVPDIGAYEKADTDVSITPWATTPIRAQWTTPDIWIDNSGVDPVNSKPKPNDTIYIDKQNRIFARFRIDPSKLTRVSPRARKRGAVYGAAYHVEVTFYVAFAKWDAPPAFNPNDPKFRRICSKTHVVAPYLDTDSDGRVDKLPWYDEATVYIDWIPLGIPKSRCIAVVVDAANYDLNPNNNIAQERIIVKQGP